MSSRRTSFDGDRSSWPNLRLPDGRALDVTGAVVDPTEADLLWAQVYTEDRYTWRTVAIRAGVDVTTWEV